MQSRGLLMLVTACLAGLLAVFLAARWMQSQGSQGTTVVVAAGEIQLGSVITPEMLTKAEWPRGGAPAGSFESADKLQGRVSTASLQRGEPLLESRLAPIGSRGGLSGIVAQGKRAITVRVNDVVGVAGFALPGTFVDVMVNTQEEGRVNERERSISKIVLERILVLAVAQEVDRDATKPKVVNAVTLEVSPEQAEALDLARSVGSLSLVLRNQTENGTHGTSGITKERLLSGGVVAPVPGVAAPASPAPAVRPRPAAPLANAPKNCVDVIRGGSKTTECF